ncbi:hypothetical protein M422DRAFT_273623 [Sphaerobolus stellatus SS14]|uniref:Uncharacterized protein n=1 Tax=Sphaerobolus stellatus (strain SS14) TaxID=990650 RepID=A0A0C9UJ74_SPHS4|nr:hypothetical protein M422DRAFT_273623 [Sphaerobolus stellatus SS14]
MLDTVLDALLGATVVKAFMEKLEPWRNDRVAEFVKASGGKDRRSHCSSIRMRMHRDVEEADAMQQPRNKRGVGVRLSLDPTSGADIICLKEELFLTSMPPSTGPKTVWTWRVALPNAGDACGGNRQVVQKRQSATVAKFCCAPVAPTNPAVAPANAPPQFPYKVEQQEGDACTTKISDSGALSLLHNLSN